MVELAHLNVAEGAAECAVHEPVKFRGRLVLELEVEFLNLVFVRSLKLKEVVSIKSPRHQFKVLKSD